MEKAKPTSRSPEECSNHLASDLLANNEQAKRDKVHVVKIPYTSFCKSTQALSSSRRVHLRIMTWSGPAVLEINGGPPLIIWLAATAIPSIPTEPLPGMCRSLSVSLPASRSGGGISYWYGAALIPDQPRDDGQDSPLRKRGRRFHLRFGHADCWQFWSALGWKRIRGKLLLLSAQFFFQFLVSSASFSNRPLMSGQSKPT